MQVIVSRSAPPARRGRIALGALVGSTLLLGGLLVGWLTFGTPFMSSFMPTGRADTTQMISGALAWSFALIAPASFVIAGLARIVAVVDSVGMPRPKTPASRLAGALGDEYVVASRLRMPDGRRIPELVLGPFGAAVIAEMPPAGAARRHGTAWEVRMSDGRWMPLENPLERAARDAETVRRWFADDDRDFLVKVYAAVIAPDRSIQRTPACAVITSDQIPAWLASLPAQRSLTAARRERLVELLRVTAGS